MLTSRGRITLKALLVAYVALWFMIEPQIGYLITAPAILLLLGGKK
jgi:hypothetical protein